MNVKNNLNQQNYFESGQQTELIVASGKWYVDALLNNSNGQPLRWKSDPFLTNEYSVNSSTVITYSFPGLEQSSTFFNYEDDVGEINATPFKSQQIIDIRNALDKTSNYINVTFVEVSEIGDKVGTLRFGINTITDEAGTHRPGIVATADPPNVQPRGGDVWFNKNFSESNFGAGLVSGSQTGVGELAVLYHEVFHALGLEHPNDNKTVPFHDDKNSREYTVMAGEFLQDDAIHYRVGEIDYTVISTPMVYDIVALQYLYGANNNFNGENTTYTFDPETPFIKTIWDSGGIDTIDLSRLEKNNTLNLEPGEYSTIISDNWSMSNNLGIAYNVIIENVLGGIGKDIIFGNTASNSIRGNSGDDTIDGKAGDDIIEGGLGNDKLTGGAGYDTFVFYQGDGQNIITDFDASKDIYKFYNSLNELVLSPNIIESKNEQNESVYSLADGTSVTLEGIKTIPAKPIGSLVDQTVAAGTSVNLSEILSSANADGSSYSWISVYDATGGNNFVKNGVEIDASAGAWVSSGELANTMIKGDNQASEQTLWIQTYEDGTYSAWDSLVLTTTGTTTAIPQQVKWFATNVATHSQNGEYEAPSLAVSWNSDYLIVKSNGIPTFEFVETTPAELRAQDYSWEIPLNPEPASSSSQVPLLGPIAITTTGLPIYGPNEGPFPHPFGDPYVNAILDYCHGHTARNGDYHFHAAPECLIEHPDGTEEHYNVIGFAADGYPLIAHYKSVLDEAGEHVLLNGETQFDWLEQSGYVADKNYQENIINGDGTSTYAWNQYDYDPSLEGVTLDDGNGRHLTEELTITTSGGEIISEKDFFGFDYGYFVVDVFPYFVARYRGSDTIEPYTTDLQADIPTGSVVAVAQPIGSIADQSVEAGSSVNLREILSTTTADGGSYSWFNVYDATGGNNFVKNGVEIDASAAAGNSFGAWVSSSDLANTAIKADNQASEQTLWLRIYEGGTYSAWDSLTFTTTGSAAAVAQPVGSIADQTVAAGSSVNLSEILSSTNADGGSYSWFQVYDATGENNFVKNGVEIDASAGAWVSSSDLTNTTIKSDSQASEQTLWFQTYDGTDTSVWDSVILTTSVEI
jgi:hypothetical protein